MVDSFLSTPIWLNSERVCLKHDGFWTCWTTRNDPKCWPSRRRFHRSMSTASISDMQGSESLPLASNCCNSSLQKQSKAKGGDGDRAGYGAQCPINVEPSRSKSLRCTGRDPSESNFTVSFDSLQYLQIEHRPFNGPMHRLGTFFHQVAPSSDLFHSVLVSASPDCPTDLRDDIENVLRFHDMTELREYSSLPEIRRKSGAVILVLNVGCDGVKLPFKKLYMKGSMDSLTCAFQLLASEYPWAYVRLTLMFRSRLAPRECTAPQEIFRGSEDEIDGFVSRTFSAMSVIKLRAVVSMAPTIHADMCAFIRSNKKSIRSATGASCRIMGKPENILQIRLFGFPEEVRKALHMIYGAECVAREFWLRSQTSLAESGSENQNVDQSGLL